MKTPEWQQRRSNLKTLKSFNKIERIDKSNLSLDRPKKLEHRRRKYNRLLKPATVNALSASKSEPFCTKLKTVISFDIQGVNE